MSRGRILFADNNDAFRTTRAQFLTDYEVVHANSVEEAERILREQWIHMAILDIRMRDDADAQDASGLLLAKHDDYRLIPKIMLTGYPDYRHVVEALGPLLDGLPPAVDFLYKDDGAAMMRQAVEKVFVNYVGVNWDLVIQSNARQPVTFPNLTALIEPGLEGDLLSQRAQELEDLFRRLFSDKSQITLDRQLWQRDGRVAVTVFAFQAGLLPENFVVVCGPRALMQEEAQRYCDFAPHHQDHLGTVLDTQSETPHFMVSAYRLPQADLEKVQTLAELYKLASDKAFQVALEHLLQTTLTAWHQNKRMPGDTKTLFDVYEARFGNFSRDTLIAHTDDILRYTPSLDVYMERVEDELIINIYGQALSYLDPISVLYAEPVVGQPVVLINSPGTITGDNVLADANGHTWLTDFADAGFAPLMWNLVALEASIRFDWIEASDFRDLYDIERALMANPFGKLDLRDIALPFRKLGRVIQAIRQTAARMAATDVVSYHLGMLFQAADRLARFNPETHHTTGEMLRMAHVLIAAAMIGDVIQHTQESASVLNWPEETGIRIAPSERAVWVDGVRIRLRGQSYDLLWDLYQHANQLCTRKDLVERVFKQTYDETDRSQINRLNTAISRLREQIEADPSHPRYLYTEPGGGYRLMLP